MTIALHEDTRAIAEQTAEEYGITLEQATNFLIRFSTMEKPGPAIREMLILDANGSRCYTYPA
jgi:hypothetical protein